MGVQHIALVVVASLLAVAAPAMGLELGELQAVPGHHPPYLFRLAIISSPRGSSDIPAVMVRQPRDALSFVKNNVLELRLRSLTDVELEVSQRGQTFNRLLLKRELQTARARLDATTAWQRYQAAKAKGAAHLQLTALLDAAYHTHQTWGQFDPVAARQPFAQIEQERLRFLAASGRDPESFPQESLDRAMLEREVQGIREETHNLVGRVTPWEGLSTPIWHLGEGRATLISTLVLGGLFIAAVTSLCTGYLMQRRALDRERQRRQVLAALIRRAPAELTSGAATLPTAQRVQLTGDQHDALEPITVVRRVRVSHKTRRRIRLQASRDRHAAIQEQVAKHSQVVARLSPAEPSAAVELAEVLGNLQRELLKLRRLLPSPPPSESPDAGPEQDAH
jgi:hypothetical protein